MNEFDDILKRLEDIEEQLPSFVQSEIKKNWTIVPQAETQFGLHLALVVDTIDPWKQNRVRFFSPLLHAPNTPIKALPFAWPISSMGGFDASGLTWVPPAGSMLCILFENGNRQAPYYLGTTWYRDRGPDGGHNWGYNIDEYYRIHEGHRKGYLSGPGNSPNDGSQVLPPWNTENYNGFDIDSLNEFESDQEAQRKITYPNIYGFSTPQKAALKIVDGNYKCNHQGKRLEIFSGCGNHFIMKDDCLHDTSTYLHPDYGGEGGDSTDCADEDGNPVEKVSCDSSSVQSKGSNLYCKYQSESRPYVGPSTPQNNKVMLPQSGMQLSSLAGHIFLMDDSVDEPREIPEWERSIKPFDFGCTDKFMGKMLWISATGHKIELSDKEEETELRGEDNYIKLQSALGNKIELNDHTKEKSPCIAGDRRGVFLQSTSNHSIFLCDEENETDCPVRKDGGVPIAKAKRAFVRLRSGYGLEIALNDFEGGNGNPGSQEETINQNIQIFCPQKDNEERGPHIMRFQEKPDGPGQVFIRTGGDYICSTYDGHITVVGEFEDEEEGTLGNPSDKLVAVSKDYLEFTKERYINIAKSHIFLADERIFLLAGKDCPPREGIECGPCVGPVVVMTPRGLALSDRVFATASLEAQCASIFQLKPFISCKPDQPCVGGQIV